MLWCLDEGKVRCVLHTLSGSKRHKHRHNGVRYLCSEAANTVGRGKTQPSHRKLVSDRDSLKASVKKESSQQ